MNLIQSLSENIERGKPVALVTIVAVDKSAPREMGAKMLVFEDGSEGTIGGGCLEAHVIKAAQAALKEGRSRKETVSLTPEEIGMVCGGEVEFFVDVYRRHARSVILGGGHVGEKLSRVAAEVGLAHVVADDRAEFATRERFPGALKTYVGRPAVSLKEMAIDETDYIVIVTRNHHLDEACLEAALPTPAAYIGLIGSKNKVSEIFQNLNKKGLHPEKDPRVYSPIGFDLGDKSPGVIAISVLAEILAVKNKASGGHMKFKAASAGKEAAPA